MIAEEGGCLFCITSLLNRGQKEECSDEFNQYYL